MREIKQHDGKVLARVVAGEWPENLAFHSPDGDFIQAGTWRYNNGKELLAHAHNVVPRESTKTQEVVYVRRGKIRARIYDEHKKLVEAVELHTGDFAVLLEGGHGYDILEDDTQVLEVKNGPYPGAEKDRTRY